MKIIYAFDISEPDDEFQTWSETTPRTFPRISVVGVANDQRSAESKIKRYADKADNSSLSYAVVDAEEFVVDPTIRRIG